MFKAECIGNLGADAVVRESNGTKFITFRIAHSEKFEKNDGSKQERTQWVDVVISNAEHKILPYLKQGVKVFVRGHATLRVYSSPKERMMVAGIQINALEIELCGGTNDAVPRELINPETSEIYTTQKFFWTESGWKGMKKEQTKKLIDKHGAGYIMDNRGFIIPEPSSEEQQQTDTQNKV